MEKKEFDNWLSRKFKEEDLDYQPSHWNKLSQNLQENKKEEKKSKIWALSLGLTAALALIFASILLIRLVNTEPEAYKDGFSLNSPYEIQKSQTTELVKETPPEAIQGSHRNNISQPKKEYFSNKSLASSLTREKSAVGKKTILEQNNDLLTGTLDGNKNSKVSQDLTLEKIDNQTITKKHLIKDHQFSLQNSEDFLLKNNKYEDDITLQMSSSMERVRKEKISIAIGGGVNYSSLNTGYTLNLSAKQKLSQDFFVDGTIAVLYNNNTENTGNFSGKTASNSGNNLITMASPAFTPWQNLYYMQVNPSFGYQLSEDIGLSLGGDVQQMMSPDNHVNKIQFTDNGIKLFPVVDFGITGKAEYDVTPNIKTGLIFREGLNNAFKSNTSPFVNRRYLQIQFKYNIPVK